MLDAWVAEPEQLLDIESDLGRLRRGDRDAFDAVMTRYQNRMFRYLLRLVGDTAHAEDLFQQTWLRVMSRIHRYDARRPFEPWLFAIARNLAIDHLRRRSPESLDEPSPLGGTRLDGVPAEEPGALETLLQRERRSYLSQRIGELPAIYREALSLRFEEDMSFEEMAELLGSPVSTVKSRVQRGLRALRDKVRNSKEDAE